MDLLGTVVAPFKWLVSAMMAGFHDGLSAIGMPAASGWTWTLSIIGLVLVIRAALIPVFLKQVNVQQRMSRLQPDLKKLQDKYKGKPIRSPARPWRRNRWPSTRRRHQPVLRLPAPADPDALLLRAVPDAVRHQRRGRPGRSRRGHEPRTGRAVRRVHDFRRPALGFAASGNGGSQLSVWILCIAMILAMTASQFITQRQIMARSLSAARPWRLRSSATKRCCFQHPDVWVQAGWSCLPSASWVPGPHGLRLHGAADFAVRWDRMEP